MTPEVLQSVLATLGIAASDLGCTLLEADGEADHVHLLVSYPPKVSIRNQDVLRLADDLEVLVLEEFRSDLLVRSGLGLPGFFFCHFCISLSRPESGMALHRTQEIFFSGGYPVTLLIQKRAIERIRNPCGRRVFGSLDKASVHQTPI